MRRMQSWVVKGKSIFIGLEDSKQTWKVCVRCEGMIVQETGMPARIEVLRSYLSKNYPACDIHVMYEAGFRGFWLHDLLVEAGVSCVVTPAHRVTQEKVNKVKTDRVDARRLALNLEHGDYSACSVPDRERREDRQVVRTLTQIQRKITSVKNQIRKFFDFHGEAQDLPAGSWKAAQYARLRSLQLNPVLQTCLDTYLDLLDHLADQRDKLKKQLEEIAKKARYREAVAIKASCPGIGRLSATRFTLEWGDLSRFPSGKSFACYTGLTSREHSSGEVVHRGRITGQGSGVVRSWLIQCAWRALKQDPVLWDKFERVRSRSGSKKKAIVAVARKLAVRLRALEVTQETYVPAIIE
jgi:transposase